MSQTKKLTPNLDQQSTKVLNLTVLQRIDPFIDEILFTAAHVSFYDFNIETNQWSRKDVEGSLFVVKRNSQPRFQFIVMNRRSTDNLVENLLDFEYELKSPYLLYRNAAQEVNGIWFYNPDECEEVANLFNRILNLYPKAPPTTTTPANRSEFEEHQPVSVISRSPLESSSAAASAIDAVEDAVFSNFCTVYDTLKDTRSYAPAIKNGRQNSTSITSAAPSGLFSPAPTVQIPASHSTSSISGLPVDSLETVKNGNQAINLVKPSTFFTSTSSSLLVPPISSSVLPSSVGNHSLNMPRPYGTPVLQPFPPPIPPLSLTPISSSKPVIGRDSVRNALLSLVQDDQFIDMMFQALLKVSPS
ncbi:mRNA-decapping enzyme-like protein isoform X2 [Vigna radiata var. radiata]|uniref:mRNA-decapping enzyme-like protein isoform X2 n=1 Tax=Vigna radiata var. radiata TaxID=3916 RepID=A0A1S3TLQ3_VIGRR|nr:mRNA-decapping enzyme-like protein isoform X2 [Vigna radiata var. radiata]